MDHDEWMKRHPNWPFPGNSGTSVPDERKKEAATFIRQYRARRATPETVYQLAFNGMWADASKDDFDESDLPKRVLYATPVAATEAIGEIVRLHSIEPDNRYNVVVKLRPLKDGESIPFGTKVAVVPPTKVADSEKTS